MLNHIHQTTTIKKYKDELERLKAALAKANGGVEMSVNELVSDNNINDDSRKRIEEIQSQIIEEKKRIQNEANEKIKQLEANTNLVEEEKIKLMEELKKTQEEQNKKEQEKLEQDALYNIYSDSKDNDDIFTNIIYLNKTNL